MPEILVTIHHHSGARVLTKETALKAIEKQYSKYNHLLVRNKHIHDRLLLKMMSVSYVYGHANKALDILNNKMLHKT